MACSVRFSRGVAISLTQRFTDSGRDRLTVVKNETLIGDGGHVQTVGLFMHAN